MGHLAAFDVPAYRQAYGLTQFVETGTGCGDSLLHALSCGFASCASIECDALTAAYARGRIAAETIRQASILEGDSVALLPRLAQHLRPAPTLWWLDAHFPGSYRGVAIDAKAPRAETMPLQSELYAICANRDVTRDVFLMDDLRIYERGHFAHGDMGDDVSWPVTGCAFVEELLGSTHAIARDYREEGYLVCLPRETRAAA